MPNNRKAAETAASTRYFTAASILLLAGARVRDQGVERHAQQLEAKKERGEVAAATRTMEPSAASNNNR